MATNFSDLSDSELYGELEKANLADKLENQPEWAMLKEAAQRIVDRAVSQFALKCEADDIRKIIMLQTIIKKYKFGLFDEIKILKMESNQLFEEAKDRGLVGDWLANVKEKLGLK